MARERPVYRCQECGLRRAQARHLPGLRARAAATCSSSRSGRRPRARRCASRPAAGDPAAAHRRDRQSTAASASRTGIGELDRVLGGGVVTGSLVLIGGDPGHRQVAPCCSRRAARSPSARGPVLYVSGEESAGQVKLRADRLGHRARGPLLRGRERPRRSIEAHVDDAPARACWWWTRSRPCSCPGSSRRRAASSQVRECGARLMLLAKGRGIATFLVGHVTKEGALAGPARARAPGRHRALLRGRAAPRLPGPARRQEPLRLDQRDRRVRDGASGASPRSRTPRASSSPSGPRARRARSSSSSLEGTRPLLLELQALVTPASFGTPRRTVLGADYNRVCLLLAVLEKRVGFPLQSPGRLRQRGGGRAGVRARGGSRRRRSPRPRAISTARCAGTSW